MGKRKLLKVQWVDSVSHAGVWTDRDWAKHAGNDLVTSVGYLQRQTDKEIILASHIAGGQIGGGMCIPASAIRKIKRLKGG